MTGECDSHDLTVIFAKSGIYLKEKLTRKGLMTTTPHVITKINDTILLPIFYLYSQSIVLILMSGQIVVLTTNYSLINSLRPSDAYMHQQINHHWFRQWLVAWPAPSHYLNHCWNIVNWTLGNKLQWNLNRNSNIFIQENAFENNVCEMASILSWPQCVNYKALTPLISHNLPLIHIFILYMCTIISSVCETYCCWVLYYIIYCFTCIY